MTRRENELLLDPLGKVGYCGAMHGAALRRAGLWTLCGALGGSSACGDDLPSVTGTTAETESSSGSLSTTEAIPTTGTADTTGDPTTGDITSASTSLTDATSTTGDPTGPNNPPVAVGDRYIAKTKQSLWISDAEGVLSNDYDPDGDPIKVIAADPLTPGVAAVTMAQTGSFTYLPPADLWGSDTFKYTITDGNDAYASATVRVAVNPTSIPLWAVAGGTGGFVIDGATSGDFSGRAVHHIGDLDGDGLDELVVGARQASNAAGRIYVVFGKATGNTINLVSLADDGHGFVLHGDKDGDFAGSAIAGVGDVDGDGVPDLMIGAPNASPTGVNSGIAYVVMGKADTEPVYLSQVALGLGGFVIQGEEALHLAGSSVQAAGDVNGDGLADVVLGAQGASPNGAFSGRGYVVFGRLAGKPTSLAAIAAGEGGGFAMNGEVAGDFAGTAISGAGDVNGDGLADIIIGAYGADMVADGAGRSYVVFGKTDPTPVELSAVAAGTGGFAMDGEAEFDKSGRAVSGAGDVNGDGFDDVIIGAPLSDATNSEAGRSYVVFGKPEGGLVALSAVAEGTDGFVINGQFLRDYSGTSVAGIGDVDADGLDDVLVGAWGANPTGSDSGRSYVVFGKTTTTPVNGNGPVLGEGGFTLDGEATDDRSGFAAAGAGDVDGDGFADVIVGAFASGAKGVGTGRSYVVFGGDYSNSVTQVGGQGPDNFAGTAGDDVFVMGRGNDVVNGQGGADIIYCGAGDDVVRVPDAAFRRIDGGTGEDTLELIGEAITLDLTTRPERDLVRIEIIDLGDGGNSVVLARRDLVALTRDKHVLTIRGEAGTVTADLAGAGFNDLGDQMGYRRYSDGITTLRVAANLEQNINF